MPHATWENGCVDVSWLGISDCKVGHYINKYDKQKATQMGQGHKVVNQTVTFNQPDWIQRGYKGNITLDNGSKLFIERNANVEGDITLNNGSTLTLNSKTLYIDNSDSKSLQQSIQSQSLSADMKDTNNAISVDEKSQLSIDELKIENSTVSLNTQNENLGKTINVSQSTLNVADGSKIPQNVNLKASTLAFDNLNSTFSLNSSKFDDTSRLRAKNLSHKQNDNITWKDNN